MNGTRTSFFFWSLFLAIFGASIAYNLEQFINHKEILYIIIALGIVGAILQFIIIYRRVINTGLNGIWILLTIVPILNFFFFLFLFFWPPKKEVEASNLSNSEDKNSSEKKDEELKINIEHSTKEKVVNPITEEENFLFAQVSSEIDNNKLHKATWTKAFSEADGQTEYAKSIYIKYRFASLKEEAKRQIESERNAREARLDAEELERLAIQKKIEQRNRKIEQRNSNIKFLLFMLISLGVILYLL
ncbi:DUF805 domain-containing protein [Pelagibacterales bacterium]|nr:DUF805 domain-containing protein [Pelagibacterales bacterium]|tara:strand:- start:628 stop:1365 length:738 start_codon:yes stop_codon:yes gene_type:complete